ncbi:MAG: YbgA family protein, partial [candidate division KSB1 bacterium]|nr:YbgA family protein [candidate division KSB1 bacterium]
REKAFFLDTLSQFREKRVPLSVPLALLKSWIARFGQPYLEPQAFLNPYPEALVEISDSGKGRDL